LATRIVFAWEVGSGLGHLIPIAALGERFIRLGFQVCAIVPAASQGRRLLGPLGIQVIENPAQPAPERPFPLSINYTANLLRNGYWHGPTVAGRINQWQECLNNIQPDIMICDHAPAALLASRGADYPRVALGNGFTLPPRATPMPSLQPWFPIEDGQLTDIDHIFLNTVNPVLRDRGISPLDRVDAMFDATERWLCIEPELDHYPIRPDETYFGAIEPPAALLPGKTESVDPAEVFLYMAAGNRFLVPILEWLKQRQLKALVYITGDTASLMAKFPESSHLHYLQSLVDLKQISAQCRLIITHGGTLTASQVLRQGAKLLICPQDLEKALLAKRLEDRKLAYGLNWFAPTEPMASHLDDVMSTDSSPENLDAFRQHHAQKTGNRLLSALVDRAESLMAVAGASIQNATTQ
jgi:Glycosyltransferase family 28 C-terminal domain